MACMSHACAVLCCAVCCAVLAMLWLYPSSVGALEADCEVRAGAWWQIEFGQMVVLVKDENESTLLNTR